MKIIVWDVDDVLNDLMKDWFEKKWLPEHDQCKLKYEHISSNPPHDPLNISLKDYLSSLDQYRNSLLDGTFILKPVPQVLGWFEKHGDRFRHIALTATPTRFASFSAAWVIQYFGRWIRSFNFVPSIRGNEECFQYDLTKAEYLKWWGKADILIDDNLANIEPVARMGIRTIIMPRPWNTEAESIETALNSLLKE